MNSLNISDESLREMNIKEDSVTITWLTTHFASSQVIYGKEGESHTLDLTDNADAPPKYGYAHTTPEYDTSSKVTGHSVAITGLTPGAKYYYRTVSRGSFAVSQEHSFTLPLSGKTIKQFIDEEKAGESGKVKGVQSGMESQTPCNYLSGYIKLGRKNDSGEVEKLEQFLNEYEGENLTVNGIYEQADFDAVLRFQKKYTDSILAPWGGNKATGYVYITTRKKINELRCKTEFPLTEKQKAEIERFKARFNKKS